MVLTANEGRSLKETKTLNKKNFVFEKGISKFQYSKNYVKIPTEIEDFDKLTKKSGKNFFFRFSLFNKSIYYSSV